MLRSHQRLQYIIDDNDNYNTDNLIKTIIGSHEKAVKSMVAFKAMASLLRFHTKLI